KQPPLGRQVRFPCAALLTACAAFQAAGQQHAQSRAFHLIDATVDDIRSGLSSSQFTCRELVSLYNKRIEAYGKSGPRLNAIQALNPRAMEEAERLDAAFKRS